jgi:hypothetical protein
MDIVGDRKFVEVPGGKTHELPPLLVKTVNRLKRLDKMMCIASEIIDQEDMVPAVVADQVAEEDVLQRRKMDLALNLVDQYLGLLSHWHWGDAVIEWIRQCEITFGTRPELRNLLRSDVWPHAGRSSFVSLLLDKGVDSHGMQTAKAVGVRLAFRQPPPIRCCSDQLLLWLQNSMFSGAYNSWTDITPSPVSFLPPERFAFEVVDTCLDLH